MKKEKNLFDKPSAEPSLLGLCRGEKSGAKAKKFESYEGITYEDCWNMDVKLAKIIATHLHAFIMAEESWSRGYPGEFMSAYGEDKGHDEWMKILHKMTFAFETYASTEFDGDASADVREKVDEGMHLFITYFRHLWI